MTNKKMPWMENADEGDILRIGAILKKKREERRFALEAIHAKTHISLKYLGALEVGDLSKFPAEVYYLSTMRQYAQYLGLEASSLVQLYRTKALQVQKEQPRKDESRKVSELKIYLGAVLFLALVVFGLLVRQSYLAHRQERGEFEPKPEPVVVSTPVAAPQVSTPTEARNLPAVQSTRTANVPEVATVLPSGKVLKLNVTINDTSWIKITADNKVQFEGILMAGSRKEWVASERFYVVVGYAPGVTMTLNGKNIDVMKGASQDISQFPLTWETLQ